MSAVTSPRERCPAERSPSPLIGQPAMGGIDRAALASCFKCFDSDNSGGIDLEVSSLHHTPRTTPAPHWSLTTTPLLGTTQELTSAFSALGISVPKAMIQQAFAEADTDGSGEVDFDEFCALVDHCDNGALVRIIKMLVADKDAREHVRQRVRPNDRPGRLEEQLAQVQAERQWYSDLRVGAANETMSLQEVRELTGIE